MGEDIASDNEKEYIFQEVSSFVFERKCYGCEELLCNMTECCDGFGHLTVSASVSFTTLHIRNELLLEERVRAAWTVLRYSTPAIACKVFRHTEGDKRFAFRYTVPQAKEDVEVWLDETIFFDTKTNGRKTLYEEHCRLKNGRWWRGSDNRYAAELHVSPLGDDWHISLVISHNSIDGRSAFAMLELFLELLKRELENETSPTPLLGWKAEVVRLLPPGSFIKELVESGKPPEISPPNSDLRNNGELETLSIIPWMFATRLTDETGDVTRLVRFSEETTTKLHAVCHRNGRTITQVVTAINVLAHAETVLAYAGKYGPERFNEVLSTFRNATHYHIPLNVINQGNKIPGEYNSYRSSKGAPLCLVDGVTLTFSMRGIKSCIRIDEETFSVSRVVNKNAFWEELVSDIAAAWKATDNSHDGYVSRDLALHHGFSTFTPKIYDLPLLIVSSIGNLKRLGLLSSFVPAPPLPPQCLQQRTENTSKQTQEQKIIVHDVICGIRLRTPLIMNLLWEYNGQIVCHFMSGGEHVTSEELANLTRRFEEWTEKIVG